MCLLLAVGLLELTQGIILWRHQGKMLLLSFNGLKINLLYHLFSVLWLLWNKWYNFYNALVHVLHTNHILCVRVSKTREVIYTVKYSLRFVLLLLNFLEITRLKKNPKLVDNFILKNPKTWIFHLFKGHQFRVNLWNIRIL